MTKEMRVSTEPVDTTDAIVSGIEDLLGKLGQRINATRHKWPDHERSAQELLVHHHYLHQFLHLAENRLYVVARDLPISRAPLRPERELPNSYDRAQHERHMIYYHIREAEQLQYSIDTLGGSMGLKAMQNHRNWISRHLTLAFEAISALRDMDIEVLGD